MTISPQEFLDLSELFKEVTPNEAEHQLENQTGAVVFVGRETCPFCRKFIPKLHKVATAKDVTVLFVHSQHPDYLDELSDFRNKYNVPTVPGLLYSDEKGVKVKCESGMSEEEIASFINV